MSEPVKRLYRVHYRGAEEDGYQGSFRVRAYSVEHAERMFYEDPMNEIEGWDLVRVERVKEQ